MRPSSGVGQAGHSFEQQRLARARRADQRRDAWAEAEIDLQRERRRNPLLDANAGHRPACRSGVARGLAPQPQGQRLARQSRE